jgi:hypothetical protein
MATGAGRLRFPPPPVATMIPAVAAAPCRPGQKRTVANVSTSRKPQWAYTRRAGSL